jgi:SagB-type dehydrogenase family enzyme
LRAPAKKKGPKKGNRGAGLAILSARLVDQAMLEAGSGGELAARIGGHSLGLGTFGPDTLERAQNLHAGLPLSSFESGGQIIDKDVHLLVRRLAAHGLLEYRLGSSLKAADRVVIEPQVPTYWPRIPPLDDSDVLVLSRFAYLRRRGHQMVLESPRAGALFRISDPQIVAAITRLSTPQQIRTYRTANAAVGRELLALLMDCQILFKADPAREQDLRRNEGDDHLVFWDFHDLLFHARSIEGRHANPSGGTYPYADVIPPLPAVRPSWPGEKIDLQRLSDGDAQPVSPAVKLLRDRHSTRNFDDQRPITLAELSQFLDGTARVRTRWRSKLEELGEDGPEVEYAARPYPAGGAAYELELYLVVNKCEGLARGFYHYDAGEHALVPIEARTREIDAQLLASQFAMGTPAPPQILIVIAARFGRISWKYSSIAYALILKDAGVLTQALYLMATGMGLGACAIGSVNLNLFARMTGLEFHVEGPVGQFAIGRAGPPTSDQRLA